MPSSQETDWVYSTAPRAHTRQSLAKTTNSHPDDLGSIPAIDSCQLPLGSTQLTL